MDTRSRHLLAEYHGCNEAMLDDLERLEALMRRAAKSADCSIVASVFHPFMPQGVSGVVVIEESHLSIHTWPEVGYAAVDFFTCGDATPERCHEILRAGLEATRAEIMVVERGLDPRKTSARVSAHYAEGSDVKPQIYLAPAPEREAS